MSKVQNDIKQTHIGNDNVSGISNNIISSPNMLNNSEKCPIPNKDLLSRKVIGLSFTGSGAGLISCPLFIVSVTGFITALPISLAILGIGTTAVGLYLLLSGNEVRHNNSDNNASGNTNVSKNENYCNNSEYNKEINQKNNESKLIKIDNSGTHHVLNKANLPNLNKNSITYKNQDAINKNNMYKAMISLNNTNENLGANQVPQIEINKNIVENEKNTEKSDLAPRNEINESFFQEKLNEKLNYKTDNNNSIHIENKNSSKLVENYGINGNIIDGIINKDPSILINENQKEINKTSFKIAGKINDTQNQSLNQTIESNNLIVPGENTNGETIIDSHTIQGNPLISISSEKNPLYEPKENQLDELIFNKNIIKIDKQELPQKLKDLHEPKPETKQKPEPAEKIHTDFNNQLKSNPVIKPIEEISPRIPIKAEHNDKSEPQSIRKFLTELNTIQKPELKPQPKPVKGISTIPEDLPKPVPKPIEEIPPIIPIKQENNDKLEPQSIRKILTELDTIQKSELKPQPKPVKGISTIPGNLPKPEPRSQSAEGILPRIPIKLENNDKSESQPTDKIFAKLDVIHNNKAGPNPEPKPKEKQELPPKPENPHKPDPEPELKPTEEIQIREKFLEYIYPENNKKNVNQKNKQVQGRDAGRANEIPSQIQSKISSIVKDNKNAFRTKKYTNNKDLYKELETISSKLNELFTEYVLDVTKIKDKDKYTTKISDISFEKENSITKVFCRCQIVKDKESVFDFEFLAEFREDHDDNKFLSPWEFKFKFKDKSNTPRAIPVRFPSKKTKS